MTEILTPGEPVPLSYLEIHDLSVLGGVVPDGEGLVGTRVFLAITVMDGEGNPVTVNYALTPWEAIRLGISMGDVAVQTVELVKSAGAEESEAAPVQGRKRDTSPYL